MNKDKIILDLCGGTGAWGKPYVEAGYSVINVTLPEYDVTQWKRDPDILIPVIEGEIYGILAAPPCTMFSRARTTAKTPRDYVGAMEVVRACLDIIWTTRSCQNSQLKFWCLENPMGQLRQFLGNPPNHYRGWEYGDDHVKFTDLWGYYRMPTKKFKEPIKFDQKRYANPVIPPELKHLKIQEARAAWRAMTPPGFAKAFMEANK